MKMQVASQRLVDQLDAQLQAIDAEEAAEVASVNEAMRLRQARARDTAALQLEYITHCFEKSRRHMLTRRRHSRRQ